jgi:hypothetical protein
MNISAVAKSVYAGGRTKTVLNATRARRRRLKEAAEARKLVWVRHCARCGSDHEWQECQENR